MSTAKKVNESTMRMMVYLRHNNLINGGTYKYNDFADMLIDHLQLVKPKNVSYKNFILQLCETNQLPEIPGYASTTKKKETPTDNYQKQLSDNRWHLLRFRILRRDGGRCQLCDKDTDLHVHHKKYIYGKKAWEYPENLLITLCSSCHNRHHAKKKKKQPKIYYGYNTTK